MRSHGHCGPSNEAESVKTISPIELQKLLAAQPDLPLLDVRTPVEFAETGMGGFEDAQDAGRGDGLVAEFVDRALQDVAVAIGAFALENPLPHLRRRGGGAGREPVEDGVRAGRGIGPDSQGPAGLFHLPQ